MQNSYKVVCANICISIQSYFTQRTTYSNLIFNCINMDELFSFIAHNGFQIYFYNQFKFFIISKFVLIL